MNRLIAAIALGLIAAPAFASGDVDKGAKGFKKCKACHTIAPAEGDVIVKGGKTGPNLWGIIGRQAGTEAEFGKYDEEMVALGEGGLIWNAEELAAYIPNAKEFLRERSGDPKAKTAMTPQKLKDVTDVIAYLSQFGPE